MRRLLPAALGAALALLLSACGGTTTQGGPTPLPALPPTAPMAPWAVQAGGAGICFGVAVDRGADGSVVVAGAFEGETVIGRGQPSETSLEAPLGQDIFFAGYDRDGTLMWARGAHGTQTAEPMAIASYPDGSFAVLGWFWGDLTFGPGEPSETTLSNGDLCDAFLGRFGPDGELQWVHQLCGASEGWGLDLALMPDGGIVIGAMCCGLVTLGPGEPTETTLDFGGGYFEAFVACYGSDGSFRWARGTRSDADSYAAGWGVAAFPDGSVGLSGQFRGTTTLGTRGEDEVTLTSIGGSRDLFVARYDAGGVLAWALSGGCAGSDTVDDAAAGADGTLFVAGSFEALATFPCLAGLPQALVPRGERDGYVAAYGPDGALRWVAQAGGPMPDRAAALAVRPDGGVVAVGCFGGQASFGPYGDTVLYDHGAGDCEAYVAAWDEDGALECARGIGGPSDDHGLGLALAEDGGILLTGSFADWLCLDGAEGSCADLEADGSRDAFVARLSPASGR